MTALFVSLFCRCRVAESRAKLLQKVDRRLCDDCAWREDCGSACFIKRVIVLRRYNAAYDDHDFRRALISQSLFEFRYEREVTCRE